MPFVHVRTSRPLDGDARDKLQKEIGALISILPGKTIDNCMTQLSGGEHLYMSGAELRDGAFVEVRLFGPSPAEAKKELALRLFALLEKDFGIAPGQTYMNYIEMDEWASRGSYSAR